MRHGGGRLRSPIKWFGGKSGLAERIVARMPSHACYVEVFGGAGGVLFRKEHAKSEIYNDLNGDLVNLFSVIRDRLPELNAKLEFLLPNREEFYHWREGYQGRDPTWTTQDPVERAFRFYTLIQHSFNTNLRQYKPIRTRAPASINLDLMRQASQRLQKVWIERLDFDQLIRKYDGPETFFYLDPPYAPPEFASGVYGWPDEEHDRLKAALSDIQGRYLMSYPDWPRFRSLYADSTIEPSAPATEPSSATANPASSMNSSSPTTTPRPSAHMHAPVSKKRWWTPMPAHDLPERSRRTLRFRPPALRPPEVIR